MWIGCQGYFIHAADADEFMSWAKGGTFLGTLDAGTIPFTIR